MSNKTTAGDKSKKTDGISEKISGSNSGHKKFPDVLGGVIFISIGIILLLNNFGVIPWTIWLHLTGFWPVVFVFIGLDLLSGNSPLLKILTTLIGLFIFTFILAYSLSQVDSTFENYINKNCKSCQKIFSIIQKRDITSPGRLFYMEKDIDPGNPVFRN